MGNFFFRIVFLMLNYFVHRGMSEAEGKSMINSFEWRFNSAAVKQLSRVAISYYSTGIKSSTNRDSICHNFDFEPLANTFLSINCFFQNEPWFEKRLYAEDCLRHSDSSEKAGEATTVSARRKRDCERLHFSNECVDGRGYNILHFVIVHQK